MAITLSLLLAACGGSAPAGKLPGPTSAERLGLRGEVLDTMAYEYRSDGRLVLRTQASTGQRVRFFDDAEGRLALVDLVQGADEEPEALIVYRYGAEGRVEEVVRETADRGDVLETTRFQYDDHGRVALRIEDRREASGPERALEFAYHYDVAGRLLREQPMIAGALVEYGYDAQGALRRKDTGDVRHVYELDAEGNVVEERVVAREDETNVLERWAYGYEGWSDASEAARTAPALDTPYLSATVR